MTLMKRKALSSWVSLATVVALLMIVAVAQTTYKVTGTVGATRPLRSALVTLTVTWTQ